MYPYEIIQAVDQMIDGGEIVLTLRWKKGGEDTLSDFTATMISTEISQAVDMKDNEETLLLENWIDALYGKDDMERQFHGFAIRKLKELITNQDEFLDYIEADKDAIGCGIELRIDAGEEVVSGLAFTLTFSRVVKGFEDVPEESVVFKMEVPLSVGE